MDIHVPPDTCEVHSHLSKLPRAGSMLSRVDIRQHQPLLIPREWMRLSGSREHGAAPPGSCSLPHTTGPRRGCALAKDRRHTFG